MFEFLKGNKAPENTESKGAFPGIHSIGNYIATKIFGSASNDIEKYHSWVFKATSLIAQECASTTLRLYKKTTDGKRIEVTSHKLLDLLARPNPEMSQGEFIEWLSAWLDLDGNSYIFTARNGETIQELWPLRSDWVRVRPDESKARIIGGYLWENGKTGIALNLDEVIHIKNFNPKFYDKNQMGKGLSTVSMARDFIVEDETIRGWNRSFFENGAVTTGVLKTSANLTEEQKTQLDAKWRRQYEGSNNANKTIILSGGLDWTPVQFSQKDLAFIEQRKLDRDDIFALFGVPKGLLMSDDVNLANAKMALWVFTRFTVRPRLKKIEDMLNATLVKAFGDNLELEFDNPVPNDRELELKEYEMSVGKWMTPNEIRDIEGLPAIKGGDELNLIISPFDSLLADDTGEKARKIGKAIKDAELVVDERIERGEKAWNEMLKAQRTYEVRFKEAFTKYFNEAKSRALGSLSTAKGVNQKAQSLLDKKKEVGFIIDFLDPLQEEYFALEGRRAMNALGLGAEFVMSDEIKKRLHKSDLKLAGAVTDTTVDAIKEILSQEGVDAMSIQEITEEIGKYFDDASQYRAERIARSETILSSNSANEEAWSQSGVVESKEWYTSNDERVCSYCDEMDGQTVSIGEDFFKKGDNILGLSLDYRDIGEPPLHSQCRCVLLPVLK